MSRLYETLTAIERSAPRVLARMDLPGAGAPWHASRLRFVIVVCATVVVAGAVGLAVVARSPSTPPSRAPQAVAASVPSEAPGASELRERARRAAAIGSLAEAQALFERALALDRDDAQNWNDLGVVLVRLGQRGRGIEAFEQGLAVDSKHAETHRNLAVALDQDGQARKAASHYRAFLDLAPRHPERAEIERRLASLGPPEARQ
jgi:tetratricopeptide (TPR) repeat protein